MAIEGTKDSIRDLVARINDVPELRPMFTKLWERDNEDYRRFFFAHREVLFASIEEGSIRITLPVLFAGSEKDDVGEQILVTAAETKNAQREALSKSIGERSTADMKRDLQAVACLFVTRFVHRNPTLRALVREETEPSWPKVMQALGKEELSLDIFQELKTETSEAPGTDPILADKLRGYFDAAKDFARKGNLVDYLSAMDFSALQLPFYMQCRSQVEELLEARRIDPEAHEEILQQMYLQKLITNAGTTFWCTRCHDNAMIFNTHSPLRPLQLEMKCPKCRKKMSVATLYQPHPLIREACFSQDGMLGAAVGWLLDKNEIAYRSGSYAGGQELDFLFAVNGRNVLLECKMHRTEKDDDALGRNLSSDINQAHKHAAQVKARGDRLDEVWIVTNAVHEEIKQLLKNVTTRDDVAPKLREHSISFVEASELPTRLARK